MSWLCDNCITKLKPQNREEAVYRKFVKSHVCVAIDLICKEGTVLRKDIVNEFNSKLAFYREEKPRQILLFHQFESLLQASTNKEESITKLMSNSSVGTMFRRSQHALYELRFEGFYVIL